MNSGSDRTRTRSEAKRMLDGASARDDLVVQALQECQLAMDRGEPIDRAAMLAKYSEIRNELSSCLDGLELMQSANLLGPGPTTAQLSPRATLGDFQIVREIGRGGMGVVYEAEQLSIGRKVALKVLPYAAMLDRRQIARFQNEARAAATIEHPHIVPVYFVGNDRGVYYYAMRLVHGQNLSELLTELRDTVSHVSAAAKSTAESTLRASDNMVSTDIVTDRSNGRSSFYTSVAKLGVQVAEALDFAHRHGIIHRDIKPANIMIDEVGDAWVTDFGLARIESDVSLTMTGDLVGTLRYMSPEQIRSTPSAVDHRSDVYSLGATLYELLTLQPIFVDTDRTALLRKIEFHVPKAPSKIDPGIPRDLETIILKSLHKSPNDRYESASDLADDLNRYLTHTPIEARRTPATRRVKLWARRHPILVAAAAMVLTVALLASTAIGFLLANHEYSMRIQQAEAAEKIERAYGEKTAALNKAEITAENLRQRVYVGEMRQAFEAWNLGWTNEVETLLAKQVPHDGQTDYRGFEWQLLSQLSQQPPAIELRRHEGPVHDIAVFDDGKQLASVGDDCAIRVWDLINSREAFVLKDTRRPTQLLGDIANLLWNRGNENSVLISKPHSNLLAVAVSPDGTKLATGNLVLSLWDLPSRKRIRDLAVFPTRIHGIVFSPDGQQVAAHAADEGMKVVSLHGELLKSETTGTGAGTYRISFSNDGSRFFAPYNRRTEAVPSRGIRSWNTNDWRHADDYPTSSSVRGTAISRDDRSLFCGTHNGRIRRIDLVTDTTHELISAQRSRPNDVAISPSNALLAVAYSDGTVGVARCPEAWNDSDPIKLKPQFLSIHEGSVNAVQFVDEHRIVTAGDDGTIRISQTGNESAKHTIRGSQNMRCRFRPGSKELILATYHGFKRYRTDTWEVIEDVTLWHAGDRPPRDARVTALTLSPDGNLAVVGDAIGELVLYDLQACRVIRRIKQHDVRQSEIEDITFSPNGKWIANGSRDHTVRIRSLPDLAEVHRIKPAGWGVNVEFSPDSDFLAYSDSDGEFGIVETTSGEMVAQTRALSGFENNTVVFSGDGHTLVSAHRDSTICIWSARDLKLLKKLNGHMKLIKSLCLHPNGRVLVSTGWDKTVRLWHLPTCMPLGILASFPNGVWDCGISSDGTQMAIVTNGKPTDGVCHVWSVKQVANFKPTPGAK